MKLLSPLAVLTSSLALAAATTTEIVYLVNCYSSDEPAPVYSSVGWFSNRPSGLTKPDAQAWLSDIVTWEGNTISASFADGDTFVSKINAGSFSAGQYAGYGYNDYR
jgi:hypothetical protein